MLKEMTGINTEKILVKDLKNIKVCCCFIPHLLTPDQKHQCTASSVEFIEMIFGRNALKGIVTGNESWCFKYVRMQLG
jgi:hypothetical protein